MIRLVLYLAVLGIGVSGTLCIVSAVGWFLPPPATLVLLLGFAVIIGLLSHATGAGQRGVTFGGKPSHTAEGDGVNAFSITMYLLILGFTIAAPFVFVAGQAEQGTRGHAIILSGGATLVFLFIARAHWTIIAAAESTPRSKT